MFRCDRSGPPLWAAATELPSTCFAFLCQLAVTLSTRSKTWMDVMKKNKLGSGVGFRRRGLRLEQLEGRSMLAGNVFVSVDAAGDLIITGDNADNAVLVQQGGAP